MASPKKRPAAPKPPALTPPAADYNPSTGRTTLAALLPRWPALDPKHRRAFQKLANDLDRAKLGARTKGIGVLQDGITWATQMDASLRQYGTGALKSYSPARYVYFLELLTALAARHGDRRHRSRRPPW